MRLGTPFVTVLACLLLAVISLGAHAGTFAPAFGEADIDFANCRQLVDGKAAPAAAEQVKRALGFFPAAGNWEDKVWEVGGGKDDVPQSFEFLWFDRNGNGEVDAAEIDFQRKTAGGNSSVGPIDEKLGCTGKGVYYEVTGILPSGVPEYKRSPAPGHPHYRLGTGEFLTLHTDSGPETRSENFAVSAERQRQWSYPASGGVSGLSIPPWEPGMVSNQFGIIGHDTAAGGDLGEFFVIHDNTGQWRIWTADGLLAGNLLYHKADPRAHFFGPPDLPFGGRLDPLSGNQEHFHGFFTRLDNDPRAFLIAGFTQMAILEVKGLDKFRRASGTFQVTAADLERVKAWDSSKLRRQAGGKSPVLVAREMADDRAPAIDGHAPASEWPSEVALPTNPDITFRLGYDMKYLYLCWTGKKAGTLANDGGDLHRLFKTGACLDFQIGTDEKADPKRAKPVRGDLRLLIAFVGDKPWVVLYQPVAPGADAKEAWATRTAAAGETRFDRVVQLAEGMEDGVKVAMSADKNKNFTVEAAIPLEALGLVPVKGMRVRGDWGVLTSDDGRQVKARAYWSNASATGTADEAVEARLEPALWGTILFE